PLNTRKRSLLKRPPPFIKRHLDHTPTESLNRLNLRLRRSLRRDHGARNPEPSRTQGDTLGHVARGRCHHATLELLVRQARNSICGATNLERSNRLEI